MNQQTMQEMMQMLANAITAGNLNIANQAQTNSAKIIPPLPDISVFEASDDRSRITDFLERFEFALDCANPNAEDGVKVKCLMNKLSEASFAEYAKFILPKKVTDLNFGDTVKNLQQLFAKPQSLWLDRYECLRATRSEGEEFQSYVNRHRRLLRDFNFTALKEEQFKVLMLLTSLKSSSEATIRQRILSKLAADADHVKYDSVIEDINNFMSTVEEAKLLEASPSNLNINAVQWKNKNQQQERKPRSQTDHGKAQNKQCWRCGGNNHGHADCRHKSAECYKCGDVGHIKPQCDHVRKWRRQHSKNNEDHVNMGAVRLTNQKSQDSLLNVDIKFNNTPTKFHLDTGAEAVVINTLTHKLIGSPRIHKSKVRGRVFDGTLIPFIGKAKGTFEFNQKKVVLDYYVAKGPAENIFGRYAMDAFGLLDELKQKISGSGLNKRKDFGSKNAKVMKPIKPKSSGDKRSLQHVNMKLGNGPTQRTTKDSGMEPFSQIGKRHSKIGGMDPRQSRIWSKQKGTPRLEKDSTLVNVHPKHAHPIGQQKDHQMKNSTGTPKGKDKQLQLKEGKAARPKFAIGDEVTAWHRISRDWLVGVISKRKGFLYDVIFSDGFTGRFHVNSLRKLNPEMENDQLSNKHQSEFGLPQPSSKIELEPTRVVEPDQRIAPEPVKKPEPEHKCNNDDEAEGAVPRIW